MLSNIWDIKRLRVWTQKQVFKLHNMNYSILKWRKEPKVLEVFTRAKVFLRGNSMVDFISAYLPKMSGMHLS